MAPYLAPEWLEVEKELGGRLVLGGTMENYRAGGEAIGKYIRAHLPPPRDDGLECGDEKINDNVTTYKNASKLGGDQKRVFMLGSSCGGTLSLATAHRLIELGREGQLKGVINMAGGTVHPANVPKHLQYLMKSMEENATDVPIIDGQTAKMINASTGLDKHVDDEWLFPLLSSHLDKFPRTYLVACGADPLRDDNVAMEHELRSKGIDVKLDTYEGLPHVFWMFPTLSATKTFIGNLLAGIKFILE
ncbi:sterigmatocystin biosynthesis lipase esterase STCI [Fusarium pseudoanthophilum]|uniref:Sterigmatocystin biosynthesis lipase esterase STCI n=1 Tax=Fusarium pseudoanthophilum TaxID=48495 RepID=A0A8H5KBF3_9HYPO|nr:sterigmatocystin biosynthesis lipase esterase STCI [Fusarium pseudoanthophilum]